MVKGKVRIGFSKRHRRRTIFPSSRIEIQSCLACRYIQSLLGEVEEERDNGRFPLLASFLEGMRSEKFKTVVNQAPSFLALDLAGRNEIER